MSDTSPPHFDAGGFEHTLTKKAGPLPVWAWGLGVGAVLVILLWMHNRNSANSTPTATSYDPTTAQDAALAGSDAYDNAYQQGYAAGGGGTGTTATDTTAANTDGTASDTSTRGSSGPRNNNSWLRKAAAALIADGVNPLKVSRILNKYLTGQPLNHKQKQVVKQAIQAEGLPPSIPKNVSVQNHTQTAHAGAHSDHTVQPHVSNANASSHPHHHTKVH